MTKRPDVSVVIPTRNRLSWLKNTLSAALAQREVDLEVIVVDDASTDATACELNAVSERRVRVVRHPKRCGVAAARNAGIAHAQGACVAFLDDDDLWSPWKLRTQLDRLCAESAVFAYASVAVLDEGRRVVGLIDAPDADEMPTLLVQRNVMPAGCSNVLVKTELLRRLQGFDKRLCQLADWDLWIRLLSAGRGAACPEVLVAYIQHSESMLLTRKSDLADEFEYLVRKHKALAPDGFGGVYFSRWVADGHRRGGRRAAAARVYLRAGLRYRNAGNVARAAAVLVAPARAKRGLVAPARAKRTVSLLEEPDWLDLYR